MLADMSVRCTSFCRWAVISRHCGNYHEGNRFMSSPNTEEIMLDDRANRKRLAGMVTNLFACWDLSDGEACMLLGKPSDDLGDLRRYRNGAPIAEDPELIQRIGHLLAIHKALRIIFPRNKELAYRWASQPNSRFEGKRALDIMTGSCEGLAEIRRSLETELVR